MSKLEQQHSVSLQDRYAPNLICFGCGPANHLGLQIKSFVKGERVVATFDPQPHHQAFEGMVSGGILGALLDCHMNWTAAWSLKKAANSDALPCTVTAHYEITFQTPTPIGHTLFIEAWVKELGKRKAVIEAALGTTEGVTSLGNGTFVAVKEGHPAHHRW